MNPKGALSTIEQYSFFAFLKERIIAFRYIPSSY